MTAAGSENGGGAIYNAEDPLTVTASTVAGNAANLGLIEFVSNGGGGVFNDDNGGAGGTAGAVTLTNTTLVNNIVAGSGNGGNEASGGGLYDFGAGGTITNTTIAGNSASFPAGGAGGGGIYESGTTGTLTLHNAIVAGNSVAASSPGGLGGRNCDFNPSGTKIVSAGHNLSDDATCALTASGDQPNTTPGLGPLTANGGPTQTEALLPGSSAIDHGDNTGCPATDQRGVTRPVGSACDVGAYEYAPPTTSATVVACSGTLQATLTPAPGSTVVALLVRIDGGVVRTIPAGGNPAVVTVALASGQHTVEYWGESTGGDVEQGHHTVSGASDTGLPTATITSSPRSTVYGFGTRAILTIHARSPAGLLGRPDGTRVKLATNRAGVFTFTATVTNICHRSRTVHYRYRVMTLFNTTFTLPASGRCLRGSKLAITIHAPPGVRLTQIVVTAGGNRVQRHGRLPRVLLVPFPRFRFFTLHVSASGPGRVVSGSVRYRVC